MFWQDRLTGCRGNSIVGGRSAQNAPAACAAYATCATRTACATSATCVPCDTCALKSFECRVSYRIYGSTRREALQTGQSKRRQAARSGARVGNHLRHLCYSCSTRHLRTRKGLSVGCNLQELRCEAVQIARSSAKRCKRCEPLASLVLLAQLAPLAH